MKKQLLMKSLLLCIMCIITGNVAFATEFSAKEYSFTSEPLADGLACTGTFNSSYYKMSAGQYATISATAMFGTESLTSAITVNVACGTFGTWSGAKTITLEACLCDAEGNTLTSAEYTTEGLNSTQGTYRGEFEVAKPDNVSQIASLKVVFKTFTTTNTGCARFAGIKLTYTTGDIDDSKETCVMSFSETEVTVNLGEEGAFEAPTLSVTEGCEVTYTSSNETIATVNETTGAVEFQNKVGSTTITATFAGNEDYNPASTSYTLTVVDPNASGTEEKPFTVAQVIANNNASATGVWVKGYIVGFINNNTCVFGTESAVATNIILADATNCEDSNSVVPVQLPSGNIRTALNLSDNATNLGKLVQVQGNLEAYFNMPGVKSVTAYKFPETTGFENLTVGQGEAEYFDLTGRRVENPSAGVYIRRVGSTTSKVFIR